MIKRGTKNSVLVEVEKLSDNEYSFASGVKLYMDTTYKPENFQRIYGTCVAVPELLSKGDQIKYEEGDYRFVDSIEPEVEIGDRVYFNYISVNKSSLIEYEGKCYCNIPYSAILCVVREGKWVSDPIKTIIPIGGNVLCEEYYGKDATYTEVEGKKIYGEVSQSGLITSIIKKPSQKHAKVKIVGTPLKGDLMELSPEDIVMFPDRFGFKNNIEGKDYVFIKYWDVHAIVGNQTESLV